MVAFSPVGYCLGLTAGTPEPSENMSASRCFANSSVRRSTWLWDSSEAAPLTASFDWLPFACPPRMGTREINKG